MVFISLLLVSSATSDCCILGDSIAVGVGSVNKQCRTVAKIGVSARKFNKKLSMWLPKVDTYVISLGSNRDKNTKEELIKLRDSLPPSSKVIWIIPHVDSNTVERVAKSYNDKTFHFKTGKDKVHPKSYNHFKNILNER